MKTTFLNISVSGGPFKGPKAGIGIAIFKNKIELHWWLLSRKYLAKSDAQWEAKQAASDIHA